jgi:hypothetical protein
MEDLLVEPFPIMDNQVVEEPDHLLFGVEVVNEYLRRCLPRYGKPFADVQYSVHVEISVMHLSQVVYLVRAEGVDQYPLKENLDIVTHSYILLILELIYLPSFEKSN